MRLTQLINNFDFQILACDAGFNNNNNNTKIHELTYMVNEDLWYLCHRSSVKNGNYSYHLRADALTFHKDYVVPLPCIAW